MFLGGLVTSTGSGLAVPDWPLSFGQVFPPMVGGVLYEHGHRLAASAVGGLTLVLAVWMVLAEPRPAVRVLGLLALFTVIVQGVLGGVTVLYKLPLAVSVTHACLAQAFFCLTVTLAVVTGRGWAETVPTRADAGTPPLPFLAALATTAVFGQVILGAVMRHMNAGLAIPDFPLAFGRIVPPLATPLVAIHFAHRVGALVVAAMVGWTAVRVLRRDRDDAGLRRPAVLAVVLVALQIALGAVIIWSRRAVTPTTTHVVIGAALLATSLVITLRAFRAIAMPRLVAPRLDVRSTVQLVREGSGDLAESSRASRVRFPSAPRVTPPQRVRAR